MPPDGSPDHAVVAPTPPLRPFVSHYAGSRMRDVPHREHTSLPSRTSISSSALDQVLLRRLRPVTMPVAMAWAWRRLAISDGRMAVHELARDTGFSRRHFGERFMSGFGIAPKAAAWVFRFEHACRMFLRSRRRIADVAVASGFHDQAHMVREACAGRLLTP